MPSLQPVLVLTWILILATAGRRGTDSHSLIVRIGDERQAKSSCSASGRIGEPLEFERLVSGLIAHQDRKSSGGASPGSPRSEGQFHRPRALGQPDSRRF
jgi:hypothetical protein